MKTILVPTDFSENADNALNFSIELAKNENAKLLLLNVYETSYETGAVSYEILTEERAKLEAESRKKLQLLGYKVETAGVEYECISVEGYIIDVVLNKIDEKETDLVVMGTKGATGLSGVIFGSLTAKVIEKAKCPVIAVPDEAVFGGIKKITYATDYHHSDISGLKMVIEIAEPLKAQVNVLHISTNPNSFGKEKEAMKTFMTEVNNNTSYNNLSFQVLSGENIESSLEEYLEDNSTSLMVMSTHHRDLFDRIFGKSITKHMAYHTRVPLMALHYNAKTSVKLF